MELKTILALCAFAATTVLSACAMHHGDGTTMGAPGGRYGDMARMCEQHRQMTAGKAPAEQQAAIEAHIKSMHGGSVAPNMVAHHMKMMEAHCGPGGPANAPTSPTSPTSPTY
jgi:hypothetical protein